MPRYCRYSPSFDPRREDIYFTMIVDIAREVLIVVDQIMVARSCLLAFLGVVIALWLISGDLRVLFDKWSKRFQLEVNVPKSRQFRAWSHLRILIWGWYLYISDSFQPIAILRVQHRININKSKSTYATSVLLVRACSESLKSIHLPIGTCLLKSWRFTETFFAHCISCYLYLFASFTNCTLWTTGEIVLKYGATVHWQAWTDECLSFPFESEGDFEVCRLTIRRWRMCSREDGGRMQSRFCPWFGCNHGGACCNWGWVPMRTLRLVVLCIWHLFRAYV